MKKIIRLKEVELINLIKRVISEEVPVVKTIKQDIINCLKNGNFSELSKFFSEPIDIYLDEQNYNSISKSDALSKITTFFQNFGKTSFQLIHEGSPTQNTSYYFIGNITTKTVSFRTTIYVKKINQTELIQEFRVEKNK